MWRIQVEQDLPFSFNSKRWFFVSLHLPEELTLRLCYEPQSTQIYHDNATLTRLVFIVHKHRDDYGFRRDWSNNN